LPEPSIQLRFPNVAYRGSCFQATAPGPCSPMSCMSTVRACHRNGRASVMRKWAGVVALSLMVTSCAASEPADTTDTTAARPLSPPAAIRGMIRVVIEDPPSGFPAALKARAQCENGSFQGIDAGTVVAGDVGNKYRFAVTAVDPEPERDLTVPVPPSANVFKPRNHPTRWLTNAGVTPSIRSTTPHGERDHGRDQRAQGRRLPVRRAGTEPDKGADGILVVVHADFAARTRLKACSGGSRAMICSVSPCPVRAPLSKAAAQWVAGSAKGCICHQGPGKVRGCLVGDGRVQPGGCGAGTAPGDHVYPSP
jgi:hypothetical protein